MKNIKKKLNAEKNKVVGAVKENAGRVVGNSKLEAEGARDRAKGNVQSAVENIKDAAKTPFKKAM
ncbi:MAG: CsbD family protein [Bdellovibrionota bacterium]